MTPWESKAHRIIGDLARESFEKSNRLPSGRLRRKHVPYSLPEDAAILVGILGWHEEIQNLLSCLKGEGASVKIVY